MKNFYVTTYTVVKHSQDPDIPNGAHFEVGHYIKANTQNEAIQIALEERGGLGSIFKEIKEVNK